MTAQTLPADLWASEPGYLNTASYGLPPRAVADALRRAVDDWQAGSLGWEQWDESVEVSRTRFARLVGAPVADVTIGSTTSQLLGQVAEGLPDGSRVVVAEEEFTSNMFPWLVHGDRGVHVDVVPLARLADAVERRTTLVAFSLVQSADGAVAPVDDLVAAARQHGALVAVDATQACGWLPVEAGRFDALACHAYKWLMSPRGSAFLVTTPALRERMRPTSAGWYAGADPDDRLYGPPLRLAEDARAFDLSPAWFSWLGTAVSLEVIERVGVAAIHDHDVSLANRLRAGMGLDPGDSAIVSLTVDGAEERLRGAGIRASVRQGKARLSFHAYNTEHDVDAALAALTGG